LDAGERIFFTGSIRKYGLLLYCCASLSKWYDGYKKTIEKKWWLGLFVKPTVVLMNILRPGLSRTLAKIRLQRNAENRYD